MRWRHTINSRLTLYKLTVRNYYRGFKENRNLIKVGVLFKIFTYNADDDPYEIPLRPEVECKTNQQSVGKSGTKVLEKIEGFGYIVAMNYLSVKKNF